ncbi:acetate--CoA ligase family protein [Algirhabdus cladophorae]|uniref:acetate--CoA ligase family protein n=1 Tax=Algirhabdus cladophorae TaxID=3377108 RepID=UPI003B84B106
MRLERLLNPRTIAVVGGGAWCESIIGAAQRIGYTGEIIPVHPSRKSIAGLDAKESLNCLETPPDATFIGVNRTATLDIVAQLKAQDAGGAICFASGFAEAQTELADGADLQKLLLEAAGGMPILGPNCYGFINALDQAAVWPDQHGCRPVEQGVAILTQSSNIAINLTMQKRGLPVGYMITCGNQAQMDQAQIATDLLDDPRVTAIGLHIEGFGDIRAWETLAQRAHEKGVPLVAIKVGASEQAQAATVSHTASLAGSDAAADALCERLGIRRVQNLSVFLETLKFLHINGPLASRRVASISCSGGEASLTADLGQSVGLEFPPLSPAQRAQLGAVLGPKVALANPLDYHTYVWRDAEAMAAAWSAIDDPNIDLTLTIVDYPREDICDASDWVCATQAAIETRKATGKPTAVVATLPELLPEAVAWDLMEHGVTPMHGLHDALAAVAHSALSTDIDTNPALLAPHCVAQTLSEAQAKQDLAQYGLDIPNSVLCHSADETGAAGSQVGFPVVLKGLGSAHKTELGLVKVGLNDSERVCDAAASMQATEFLVEEMVQAPIAELIIGITKDPSGIHMLTIGAGGVLTELLKDSATLLVPSSEDAVRKAISGLAIAPILSGYRGALGVNITSIVDAVMALQSYVIAKGGQVEEVEINPLICTQTRAVAVDALIRKA